MRLLICYQGCDVTWRNWNLIHWKFHFQNNQSEAYLFFRIWTLQVNNNTVRISRTTVAYAIRRLLQRSILNLSIYEKRARRHWGSSRSSESEFEWDFGEVQGAPRLNSNEMSVNNSIWDGLHDTCLHWNHTAILKIR